jgi:hypothetical protein
MKKIFTVLVVSLFTIFGALAQLPYNTTMTSEHYNDATIVKSDGDNGWDGGIRLGNKDLGGFDYSDKYVVIALSANGIPKKLTCATEAKSISVITPPTDIVFYVAWSADNSNFTTLDTKNSKKNSFDVELPKETKYIKLCYSGNFAGYFTNIVVSEMVYCNAPEHDVWEPIDTIGAEPMLGQTTIVWGNTEPFELTLTGEGASQFTVAIDNNACKGKEGVALLSAIYKHDVAGVHEAVLTIANGTYSYTINLKGTTLKKEQTLVWEQDLALVNVYDSVMLNAEATTDVIYAVSDTTKASVVDNMLLLHNAGEVLVYAYARETDEYLADTLAKTLVIAPLAQEIVWTLDSVVMTVGDTLVLDAMATSGLEVTYLTDVDSVVLIESNMLVAQSAGEVQVTAVQEGNNNYLAAEVVTYTIIVVAAEEDGSEDDVVTSMENAIADQVKACKIIHDGKIYIIRGEQVYDMLGNRL